MQLMTLHIGLNAHLLSSRAGYRTAGIHGYIYNMLAHLGNVAPENWRFTAMVGSTNQARFPKIEMRRSRLDTESPMRRIVWEQAIQPWGLGDFDLYHALAFVAPVVLRVPMVVTIYDLSFLHFPQVLTAARRLYLRAFTGLTCKRARRVIAISHSTARDVAESFGIVPDKIDVAAPGYNPEIYHPLPTNEVESFRRNKGLPERFWLFVGTLEPRKNLVTLLEAYACLPRTERLPLLLGGGKGWQYDDIFATIERHSLDDVHWLGFLPAEELALWYNCAETFILPSIFEGFGIPALEAMACGTPVIVSNTSSLPEVVGEKGTRLPPRDVKAWTAALHAAMHNAEWRAQSRDNGLAEAQRYSWPESARATVRSYQWALK
jgi:glycosyltransferase involved in cell wall biosynthesis